MDFVFRVLLILFQPTFVNYVEHLRPDDGIYYDRFNESSFIQRIRETNIDKILISHNVELEKQFNFNIFITPCGDLGVSDPVIEESYTNENQSITMRICLREFVAYCDDHQMSPVYEYQDSRNNFRYTVTIICEKRISDDYVRDFIDSLELPTTTSKVRESRFPRNQTILEVLRELVLLV